MISFMKKKIRLCLDANILTRDEQALKRLCATLSELEEKGFMDKGKIVFEEDDEPEIEKIFNNHYGTLSTPM